jgi:hypothetical protein
MQKSVTDRARLLLIISGTMPEEVLNLQLFCAYCDCVDSV